MKTKSLALMVASVFALVFSLVFASAALTFDPENLISGSANVGQLSAVVSFKLTANVNYSTLTWDSDQAPLTGTWVYPTLTSITAGQEVDLTATLKDIAQDFTGPIITNLKVKTETQETFVVPVTITVTAPIQYPFCSAESYSEGLELDVSMENKGEGGDDSWKPLDTIEVEVQFKNDKDSEGEDTYDLEDVTFELALYKESSTKNTADDLIWMSEGAEEYEYGDVKEGKKADHTFEFRVDPSEFNAGNYRLMVKVYGKDDLDGKACVDFSEDLLADFSDSVYYADLSIQLENDKDKMVVVDTETLPESASASCEQEVTFTADVWNVGNQDFKDQFSVSLKNEELGLDQSSVFMGDLDSGDMAQVSFTFAVPKGTVEKTYSLAMKTHYDYDTKDEEYDEESDDSFVLSLKVDGNCAVPKASMSASLESGGKAGQTLTIKATVTNTGDEASTYTFDLKGYSEWASSARVDVESTPLMLDAGESQEVMIYLDVAKETSAGDYTFEVAVYSDGKSVLTQPVQVAVEGKSSLLPKNNGLLAVLAALISAVVLAILFTLIAKAFKGGKKK